MTYIYVATVTKVGRSYPALLRGIATQFYHTQVSACSYDEAHTLGANWAAQQGIGQRRKQAFSDCVIRVDKVGSNMTMTDDQESHLASIKDAFAKQVDSKYRAGQREHGGNLYDLSALDLVNMAIDEAIDQIAYLVTLRSAMTTQRHDK